MPSAMPGTMLYQLNYEATQLGESHVLHTSSSWGLSMTFWPGLSYATLVSLCSADRFAQLVEHRTTVRERSRDQNPGRTKTKIRVRLCEKIFVCRRGLRVHITRACRYICAKAVRQSSPQSVVH